jgi:flagellin-like protein
MKITNSKKAISPVITTVLLVLMVLVLASIIIIWWNSFMGESITKLDESSKTEKAIEDFCTRVVLDATLSGASATIVNRGSIPVYKVGFQKVTKTSTTIQIFDYQIVGGASQVVPIGSMATLGSGDKLYLIPVLLGNDKNGKQKEFQCPEENWKQII